MRLEVGQQIGKFTVLGTLGHGGMSDVYRARDEANAREVVLKFPHEDMMGDPATYERFCREVKIGNTLTHANIQKLYELGGDQREPFLVLEFVPGHTLRDELRQRKARGEERMPVETAVSLGAQIAEAVEYAHEKHVFHRDLKPENVIVTPEGTAKVMDFGIALMEGAKRITWGALSAQVGTPDYMAPEQIKGQRGDQRTDVYAVGMMLYEMIAGSLPYDGDNALAIMNQHVTVSPPPLHCHYAGVPHALEEVVLKAIRRNAEHRWPTMQAFRQALLQPESVDATALQTEREAQEINSVVNAPPENDLGMHGWQIALIVVATILVMVTLTLSAQLLHGHK